MGMPWPEERTLVQELQAPDPRFDVRTDAVAAYGVNASLPARIAGWRARGYRVAVMTGLAWGEYQDYLLGGWDGRQHWDEAQIRQDGTPKQHGENTPYMVPTPSFGMYLLGKLRQAIDEGAEAIYIEEPEFWSYTGYGPAFQAAWLRYYGEVWRDPAGSPADFARATLLKQELFAELIATLCAGLKAYTVDRAGGPVPCYVATHSPLNYTAWAIASPEFRLRQIPGLDGVIVQTWSFTARSQTTYEGRRRERIPAVAFLEYGSGIELVRGMDRSARFLVDPVEDSPKYGWDRYRTGYEATVAAALLHPEVGAYEAMPWPSRVFTRSYPSGSPTGQRIPQDYAAEVLAVANAMRSMPPLAQPVHEGGASGPIDGAAVWDCGTRGLGVAISDTMQQRRGGPENPDDLLSSFYGLALPLLLAGMPVRPVALETLQAGAAAKAGGAADSDTLRLLLLSYDGMTPPGEAAHDALAAWVRAGGILICFGAANGPYETLQGWWNGGHAGTGPWPDLYRRLGLQIGPGNAPPAGPLRAGQGVVLIEPSGPIELARRPDGAALVRERVREALGASGPEAPAFREQGYLLLRRGPYVAAMAPGDVEDLGPGPVLRLSGSFVDLFDGNLAVRREVQLRAGEVALAIDLDRLARGPFQRAVQPAVGGVIPCVVAAAARIEEEVVDAATQRLRFVAIGPTGTTAVLRLRLPAHPVRTLANGHPALAVWDAPSGTAQLQAANDPDGVVYDVGW